MPAEKSKGSLPRYKRAAARATSILDSFGFRRLGPVVWDEDEQAFVVRYPADDGLEPHMRVKFLGPGPASAVQAAMRERSKALAPERRAAAREGFAGFLQVLGAVAPIVGGVIGNVERVDR